MPGVISFAAGGYVPATGKIYIVSGYNTGSVDSAQPNTWQYDPVADSWTDLTGTVPFPHPAGGMSYGVINNKVYIAGGRDPGGTINLTWEFDPSVPAYTARADMPGTQPNQAAGAVALSALFVFGGGNPFLAPGSAATTAASAPSKATSGTTRAAFPIALGRAAAKDKALIPQTTNHTYVYDP